MARTDTPLAPHRGLPLLAGPLPGRLLRCLQTMQAATERPPDPPADVVWRLASAWAAQACRSRAADLADLVGYTEIAEALRDEVDREAPVVGALRDQADAALRSDPGARARTRAVLAERWEPLPDTVVADDVEHLLATLFGAPRGRAVAARVDEHIDALPGLDGLRLMVGALDRRAAADRWAADVFDLRAGARRCSPVPA